MTKDNKIITAIIAVIASAAVCLLLFFGVHYLFGNPAKVVFAPDMKTFTVVGGADYTTGEIADYLRNMKSEKKSYKRITDKLYCAEAENVYENLNTLMQSLGYKYIGCDGTLINMRCFYRDGKALWVRVEYDLNAVWCLWNFSDEFEYDLAKAGYKTMDY